MSTTTSGKKRTYLELSEDQGTSHKFYEVVVEGKDVTIRYGRIGTDGASSTKSYPNEDKAIKDAEKKIKAKKKKGYEDAVMGVRTKRAITRRSVDSQKSTAKAAPVVWKFHSSSSSDAKGPAFGIFVNDESCWVGNQAGRVFCLDPSSGKLTKEYKLPEGVKCLVADDEWLYAGCDDGKVYDLSRDVPMVAYSIKESVNIYWLDIVDGILTVSDAAGGVYMFNHEDEDQWSHESGRGSGGDSGWMVRCDEDGVYHGHSKGVTMYNSKDGKVEWETKTDDVLFGCQEQTLVFAATTDSKVHVIEKKTGTEKVVCPCDATVYSCAAAEDGVYVFAGDCQSSVYCFDAQGKRQWKLGTGCGSALSMQFYDDHLYVVTTDGYMACIDASPEAISKAEKGTVPKSRGINAPKTTTKAATTDNKVESTSDRSGGGVVVVCIQDGSRVRVRPEEGNSTYDSEWNVQFPKNLREAGAKFIVEELREARQGGFYRAHGTIRRLV